MARVSKEKSRNRNHIIEFSVLVNIRKPEDLNILDSVLAANGLDLQVYTVNVLSNKEYWKVVAVAGVQLLTKQEIEFYRQQAQALADEIDGVIKTARRAKSAEFLERCRERATLLPLQQLFIIKSNGGNEYQLTLKQLSELPLEDHCLYYLILSAAKKVYQGLPGISSSRDLLGFVSDYDSVKNARGAVVIQAEKTLRR